MKLRVHLISWTIVAAVVGFFVWVATAPIRLRSAMQKSPIVVIIDGCQYLECETYYGRFVWSHKGNCTNHTK